MSVSINKRPIISLLNPKSPNSESYRMLRTNIDFSSFDTESKILMVTSAAPGEGKSTTVANLAVVYAQSDKKVILIDADLRKPTLHHTLQKSNRAGLSHVLTGQAPYQSVIQNSPLDNLDLITSGPIPPNPSELLSSPKMKGLLDSLAELYDIILFDAPPVLAVTDSQVLSAYCNGVILVVHSGKTKKEALLKAKSNLERAQARVLGVVLNNMKRSSKDQAYYYYYGENEK